MRIQLVVDGERHEVEVDLARGEARLSGHPVPFRVVSDQGTRAELELDGERFVLEGWSPETAPGEARTLVINRELHRLEVRAVEGSLGGPAAGRAPSTSGPASPSASSPAAKGPAGAEGPGTAITPPMPGKVLEVRVKEGESVVAGQTLLVLEAMKMRNEVQSPSAGKVAGLTARPGTMVKAHEVLLRVVPG